MDAVSLFLAGVLDRLSPHGLDVTIWIEVYLDGPDAPHGFETLVETWTEVWAQRYGDLRKIGFRDPVDLKGGGSLPGGVAGIALIRNPDVFFRLESTGELLGGVEVTTHSPDGSNIEKRYPYLWASRELSIPAFVATPYQKWRPGGEINRMPRRHMERNLVHLNDWIVEDTERAPIQLMAIRELHGQGLHEIEASLRNLMPQWKDLAEFFAARTVQLVEHDAKHRADAVLRELRSRWIEFVEAAIANTRYTDASTLHKRPDRWIQVYNARPDTGHWERGEGQFDSIDGRLMFTLESIEYTPEDARPESLEFWLPQMVSSHPWIEEQRKRGFGSKRLRNILQVLPERAHTARFVVKFSDQLTDDDWRLLQDNPSLCLERLDPPAELVEGSSMVAASAIDRLCSVGLRSKAPRLLAAEGLRQLRVGFVSTHRCYDPTWKDSLEHALDHVFLETETQLLLPRIPDRLAVTIAADDKWQIVPAELITKAQLLGLRQLHRTQAFGV